MRRIIFYLAVASLILNTAREASQAQAVRVGPGFVRAPYAAVDWLPNGAAHVRAPFVNVYGPRFPFAPPFPLPPVPPWIRPYPWVEYAEKPPSVEELSQMDYQTLGQVVAKATALLNMDLDQLKTGQLWKAHLKTAELAALLPKKFDTAPPEDLRAQLQNIFEIHRATAESLEYAKITGLETFQVLGAALAEYLTPQDERLRRQLFLAAGALDQSLDRFKTGGTWQQYLELAPGKILSPNAVQDATVPPTPAEMAELLARFDSVQRSEEFRVIAAVPEFKATHELLAAYVGQARVSSLGGTEELPTPRPASVP